VCLPRSRAALLRCGAGALRVLVHLRVRVRVKVKVARLTTAASCALGYAYPAGVARSGDVAMQVKQISIPLLRFPTAHTLLPCIALARMPLCRLTTVRRALRAEPVARRHAGELRLNTSHMKTGVARVAQQDLVALCIVGRAANSAADL